MEHVKEHIYEMAKKMEVSAKTIRRIADKMEERSNIDYTQDVISEVTNLQIALKLPVFISRIVRSIKA